MSRKRTAWIWRVRYWWLDTKGGREAQLAVGVIAALVAVIAVVRMGLAPVAPPPHGAPAKAVIWWIIYLVVAIVAALVSYAMRPKPQNQPPQEAKGPTTEDGQAVVRYWGTHWIEDEFLLAWAVVGRDPIKGGGGK